MRMMSAGTEWMPRLVDGDASVGAAASFGFRVRCGAPLRFLRSGGGGEPLDVVGASEPAQRPATAPCADWPLAGLGGKVRGTLSHLNQGFELLTPDLGGHPIRPQARPVK